MTIAFLVTCYVLLGIVFWLMPKRLTSQDVYLTWITVSLITLVSDLVFGDLLNMYDLINPGPEFLDVFVEVTLPACFGVLFMNFLPRGGSVRKFIRYYIFWVLFSLLFERLSVYIGYVHYIDWKVWYSLLFYFGACAFMYWHYWFMRKASMYESRD